MQSLKVTALVAFLIVASAWQAQANLVSDPGFEGATSGTDDPAWTFTPAASGSDFTYDCPGNGPHGGSRCAGFGGTGTENDRISQTLATIAGHHYSVSFWYTNSTQPNDLEVKFGSDTLFSVTDDVDHDYIFASFTATATASSTELSFAGLNNLNWMNVDDVAVEDLATAAVPEPASAMVLVLPAVGLLARRRRR